MPDTPEFDSPMREFTDNEIAAALKAIREGKPVPIPGIYRDQADCTVASTRFTRLVMAEIQDADAQS